MFEKSGLVRVAQLKTPNEIDFLFNLWVQTRVDGASERRLFQFCAHLWIERERTANADRQFPDASRRAEYHLFFRLCSRLKIDPEFSSGNPHQSQHAGGKSNCDEIGRRKVLPFSLVILGRIGDQLSPALMRAPRPQIPLVSQFYHCHSNPYKQTI